MDVGRDVSFVEPPDRRHDGDMTPDRAGEIVAQFEFAVYDLQSARKDVFGRLFTWLGDLGIPGFGGFSKLSTLLRFRTTDTPECIVQLINFSLQEYLKIGPVAWFGAEWNDQSEGCETWSSPQEQAEKFFDELDDLRGRIYADFAEILMRAGIVDLEDVDEVNAMDLDYAFVVGDLYKLHLVNDDGGGYVVPAYCRGLTTGVESYMSGAKTASGMPIFYFNVLEGPKSLYIICKEYLRQEPDRDVYWQFLGFSKTGEVVCRILREESISRPGG